MLSIGKHASSEELLDQTENQVSSANGPLEGLAKMLAKSRPDFAFQAPRAGAFKKASHSVASAVLAKPRSGPIRQDIAIWTKPDIIVPPLKEQIERLSDPQELLNQMHMEFSEALRLRPTVEEVEEKPREKTDLDFGFADRLADATLLAVKFNFRNRIRHAIFKGRAAETSRLRSEAERLFMLDHGDVQRNVMLNVNGKSLRDSDSIIDLSRPMGSATIDNVRGLLSMKSAFAFAQEERSPMLHREIDVGVDVDGLGWWG